MTITSSSTPDRFEVLDSWRGICALLVSLLHMQVLSDFGNLAFFKNAFLFVDFFFVLSGFVIAANYEQRLANGFGLGRFMLLRFGRLYPLYFVILLAFVGFELLQVALPAFGAMGSSAPFSPPRQSIDTIITSMFLLQTFHIYDFLTWNTPGWSIATEFWTYLVFGLVIVYFPRIRSVLFLVAIFAGSFFLLVASPHGMNTTYDFGMIRCVVGFSAGVLSHWIWRKYLAKIQIDKLVASFIEFAVLGMAIAFISYLGLSSFALFAPLVFAVAVLVFAKEAGILSQILQHKFFQLLGTLSYSIYMVHLFVATRLLNIAQLIQSKLHFNLLSTGMHEGAEVKLLGLTPHQGDLWAIGMLVIVVGVSFISYHLVEVPGRNWFRKLARR
jgi:peptidoglycan/LPS O-acetylase OafA/YrhL